jgi:hypothetical protein
VITSSCQAVGCTNEVTQTSTRGRPTVYCSPACRPSSYKRRPARRLSVEIGHEPTEPGFRPVGRVWFVQLGNGTKNVVVASGLGRPSADHLAGQLSKLLGQGDERATGGVVE